VFENKLPEEAFGPDRESKRKAQEMRKQVS
jgi:hypothetical protein